MRLEQKQVHSKLDISAYFGFLITLILLLCIYI